MNRYSKLKFPTPCPELNNACFDFLGQDFPKNEFPKMCDSRAGKADNAAMTFQPQLSGLDSSGVWSC